MGSAAVEVGSDEQDSDVDVGELEGTCIVDNVYEDIQRSDQVCLECVGDTVLLALRCTSACSFCEDMHTEMSWCEACRLFTCRKCFLDCLFGADGMVEDDTDY